MNRRYGVLLGALGLAQAVLAFGIGAWGAPLIWSAASFLGMTAAYLGVGPRLLGKRENGRLAPLSTLVLLPYLLLTWSVWELQRRSSRDPVCHEITPGLWLGRRPLTGEIPEACRVVVDLTCEFPESTAAIGDRRYFVLPTLDAGTPGPEAFSKLVTEMANGGDPVYVHCALGRGRSAMFVAAVLLARGEASSAEEAEALIRAIRPSIKLAPNQRAFFRSQFAAANETPPSESSL
jgi:protein-tyrosine phosphatase